MLHLTDRQAAIAGVVMGPLLIVFGLFISDAFWDRNYGTPAKAGRLYTPVLRRVPRAVGRAFFVGVGVLLTLAGVLLFVRGG